MHVTSRQYETVMHCHMTRKPNAFPRFSSVLMTPACYPPYTPSLVTSVSPKPISPRSGLPCPIAVTPQQPPGRSAGTSAVAAGAAAAMCEGRVGLPMFSEASEGSEPPGLPTPSEAMVGVGLTGLRGNSRHLQDGRRGGMGMGHQFRTS